MSDKHKVDTSELAAAILPNEVFAVAESMAEEIFELMMRRMIDLISNPIKLPPGVTAEDYAERVKDFLDGITYDKDKNRNHDQHFDIHYRDLKDYELDYTDCFYTLAKSNPEIALHYYDVMEDDHEVDIDAERLPVADNFELYIGIINKFSPENNINELLVRYMESGECSPGQFKLAIDTLGAKQLLIMCEHIPDIIEKITEHLRKELEPAVETLGAKQLLKLWKHLPHIITGRECLREDLKLAMKTLGARELHRLCKHLPKEEEIAAAEVKK